MGDYHTKVMEYTFLALQEEREKKGRRLTPRQICDVFDVSLREFKYGGKLHPENERLRRVALEQAHCESDAPFGSSQIRATLLYEPAASRTDYITESGMTPAGQALLVALMDITNSPADDYDGYIAAITGIENDAANTLGQDEVEIIFQLSSLARQSAWYWTGNMTAWWVTLGGNEANCVDVCTATPYTLISPSISVPFGPLRPQGTGFSGPVCTYTCSPSGRRIAKIVLAADLGMGAERSISSFIVRRVSGLAISWPGIAADAAATSLVAAAGIAVASWYY